MSPQFFFAICVGAVLCLTPFSIYLYWLGSVNRRKNPTIVSAVGDFTALLAGLAGFLFCTGILLGSIITEAGLFLRGPLMRWGAQWPNLPWETLIWLIILTVYFLLIARAVRLGMRARRDCLCVYNVDDDVLRAAIDEAALTIGERDPHAADVSAFPVFRHATVKLLGTDAVARGTLERQLRLIVPQLPAAREHPSSPWITAASTCCTVCVVCCIALIFALPFLKGRS